MIFVAILLLIQSAVPINSTPVSCPSTPCTYTDVAVAPGSHTYFVTASLNSAQSNPSNSATVTVPAGTHNVLLSWTPSTTPNCQYKIFRIGPASGLQISNSN
jgi:hypothetical protein